MIASEAGPVRALRAFLVVACIVCAGCGPVRYLSDVGDAEEQLAAAEQRNARTFAAYEYFAAEVYLEKAREEAGEGHYEEAIRFARNAREFARQAERRAQTPSAGAE